MSAPDQWTAVPLENLCVTGGLVRGPFGGSLKKSEFVDSGYQVYEQRHAIGGTTLGARYFVTAQKYAEMKRFSVRPGDFIVSCSGTIGRVYRIPEGAPEGIINQALLKIVIDTQVVNPDYFLAYFQWHSFQDQILDSTQGGAMQNLVGMPIFRKTRIVIPPVAEQSRIATALMDADASITTLERLIAKKQKIKYGLIQELLTGTVRLPGFDELWPEVTLGAYAMGLRGAGLSKELLDPSGVYLCVLYGELFTTYGRRVDHVKSRTNMDNGVRSQEGDVLVPGSTTTVARDLATASAIHCSGTLLGGDTNIVRPGPALVSEWLAYYITHRLGDRIAEIAQGLTIKHLYVRDLLRCRLALPPVAEQRAIVGALGDAETEIALLERRLQKARDVKQGMMQELLTGRTRLPVEEAAI